MLSIAQRQWKMCSAIFQAIFVTVVLSTIANDLLNKGVLFTIYDPWVMNLTNLIDPQMITILFRKAFIDRKYAIILIEKPKITHF